MLSDACVYLVVAELAQSSPEWEATTISLAVWSNFIENAMMTVSPTQCPANPTLQAFAAGRLAENESDAVFEHLRDCVTCASELERVDDGEDSLIADLRRPDPLAQFGDEPGCHVAVAKALAMLACPRELPQRIGEYEVVRQLGCGGMGRVYLARHSKLGREVALKLLASHRLADPRMCQRFEAEMRAVGQLSHPNVVTAHDAREIDGTAVLVTEYIDGLDLSQLVQIAGPLRTADACEIVRQVALALTYTDSQGFVHRDVKPSNIMLSRTGEVKLLDLGLARFEYGEPNQVEITGAGQTIGTADYIAPEQVNDSHNVDIRSDIYSLGCTLMKLLSGQAPFADENHRSPFAKMTAHVSMQAPRLSQKVPDAPKGLAILVDSMLQKDPLKRPQTPMEVADRLSNYTSGSDLQALSQTKFVAFPVVPRSNEVKPTRHRQVPFWVAIATGLIGLLVGIVMGTILTIQFPDGTETQIDVPPGSRVTIANSSGHDRTVSESVAEMDMGPVIQIGEGTISADDPLAFIVLLNGGEVSDIKLLESQRLLQSQLGSAPRDDRIVATDAGIWVQLAEGVAAPIVREYNGKRYALASGSPKGRIGWDAMDGHFTAAQTIYDSQGSRMIELKFDDALSEQVWEMTSNHLHHPLGIVADGTIRATPYIPTAIRNGARIPGDFSDADFRVLMQRVQRGLADPKGDSSAIGERKGLGRFQGVWIPEEAVSVNPAIGPLLAFDNGRFFQFSLADPSTKLTGHGKYVLLGNQINFANDFPGKQDINYIFEFVSDGRLKMSFVHDANNLGMTGDSENLISITLRRIGDIPRSMQDVPQLVEQLGVSWLGIFTDLVRYQASSVGEVVQAAQDQEPARAILHSVKSMKKIGTAFHNFHDAYRKLPGSQNVREGSRGINGDAPYPFSWRVAILPFIEQQDLFEQYRFDEPWDSEHNLTLLEKLPSIYRCPLAPPDQSVGVTNYLGFAIEQAGLGITGHSFAEFTDGTSPTALIVASKRSVPWTKPEDLTDVEVEPLDGGTILILKADSEVEIMSPIDRERLQKMITRAGGESLE